MFDDANLIAVPRIDGKTCFACGERNPIGLHMHFMTDGERMISTFPVPETMVGWDKTVHGGIIATILDEIMGWSIIYLMKKMGVTRSMNIEFLKPLQAGKKVTAVGFIKEIKSERHVLISGEIYSDENILCARSTGDFTVMKPQSAIKLGVMSAEYAEKFAPILERI